MNERSKGGGRGGNRRGEKQEHIRIIKERKKTRSWKKKRKKEGKKENEGGKSDEKDWKRKKMEGRRDRKWKKRADKRVERKEKEGKRKPGQLQFSPPPSVPLLHPSIPPSVGRPALSLSQSSRKSASDLTEE